LTGSLRFKCAVLVAAAFGCSSERPPTTSAYSHPESAAAVGNTPPRHAFAAPTTPPACPGDEWRIHTTDSLVSFCLPHDFVVRNPRVWLRFRGEEKPWDFLSVHDDSDSTNFPNPWPLHLASGRTCFADCVTVEHLRTDDFEIAGFSAHLERGLVTGGFSGEKRNPALTVSVSDQRHRWILIQARALRASTIDTIERAVRALVVRRTASANPR